MVLLNSEQKQLAIELLMEYAESTKPEIAKLRQEQEQLDKDRLLLIQKELLSLVDDYLSSKIDLQAFKSKIDSLNKRFQYWGFKGIKGQMFFNQLLNVSETTDETDAELKVAITIPDSEQMASSRIKTFERYVRRIGDELVEAGGSKHGRPKPGSIPFFLSYFWQVQDKDKWPVYYTNSVNTMIDLMFCFSRKWNNPSFELAYSNGGEHEETQALYPERKSRDIEASFGGARGRIGTL